MPMVALFKLFLFQAVFLTGILRLFFAYNRNWEFLELPVFVFYCIQTWEEHFDGCDCFAPYVQSCSFLKNKMLISWVHELDDSHIPGYFSWRQICNPTMMTMPEPSLLPWRDIFGILAHSVSPYRDGWKFCDGLCFWDLLATGASSNAGRFIQNNLVFSGFWLFLPESF